MFGQANSPTADLAQRLLPVVAGLYDAALEPGGWQQAAELLAQGFDAVGATLCLAYDGSRQSVLLGRGGGCPAAQGDCQAHCRMPWAPGPLAGGQDAVLIDRAAGGAWDVCAAAVAAGGPGPALVLGGRVRAGPGMVGIVGLHRRAGMPAFDEHDRQSLALLLPHLARALKLRERMDGLARDRGAALEALDTLAVGVLIVAADGRLLLANAEGQRLLAARRGLVLERERVTAVDRTQQPALDRLMAGGHAGRVMALARPGGSTLALSLMVCPIARRPIGTTGQARAEAPNEAAAGQPAAVLFLGDGKDRQALPETVFAELHGLSPAQARLATALVEGLSVKDYAERAGISVATARSQLKHIFTRTGHTRQADLIRDILADPVLYVASTTGAATETAAARACRK